jgi:hypothetical protein
MHCKNIMVQWGPKHVVATEINQLLRVTLVYLIKYCCVDGKTFTLNYDTKQDAYNEVNSTKLGCLVFMSPGCSAQGLEPATQGIPHPSVAGLSYTCNTIIASSKFGVLIRQKE